VFRFTAFSSGVLAWNYNSTDVYANGNSVTSSNSGSTWTAETTYDRTFNVNYRGLAGESVYLSDTAGGLSLEPGTYGEPIGYAITESQIFIKENPKSLITVVNIGTLSDTTVDTEIITGFRPNKIMGLFRITGSNEYNASVSQGVWSTSGSATATGAEYCVWEGYNTTSPNFIRGSAVKLGNLKNYNGATNITTTISVVELSANSITLRRVVGTYTGADQTLTYYLLIS
jgi:hypothetical protein